MGRTYLGENKKVKILPLAPLRFIECILETSVFILMLAL